MIDRLGTTTRTRSATHLCPAVGGGLPPP